MVLNKLLFFVDNVKMRVGYELCHFYCQTKLIYLDQKAKHLLYHNYYLLLLYYPNFFYFLKKIEKEIGITLFYYLIHQDFLMFDS